MYIEQCASCRRTFQFSQSLQGWRPCKCGGHSYAYCREDKQGCGHTTYVPPVNEETCPPVSFGFEGIA